jgi:hypothetical protein
MTVRTNLNLVGVFELRSTKNFQSSLILIHVDKPEN